MKKKTLLIGLAGLLGILVLVISQGDRHQQSSVLRLSGGPAGSTSQRFVEDLAGLLHRGLSSARVKALPSAGSRANLADLQRGEIDLALAGTEDTYRNLNNPSGKADGSTNLALLAQLSGAYAQLLVPQSSSLKVPGDLCGKRIAIGNPGSDSAVTAKRYLQAMHLWARVTPIYVGYELALQELVNSSVAAVWMISSVPNEAVQKLQYSFPLRLISPWPEPSATEQEQAFYQDFPFYERAIVPALSFPEQAEPLRTIGVPVLLLADSNLAEETTFRILNLLFTTHTDTPARQRSALHQLQLSNVLPNITIPLHPGALRFLKEYF